MGLPALTINTTVRVAKPVFARVGRFTRFGPTLAGLAVVPLLPFMFDKPVEHGLRWAFDNYSPWKS
jgi:fission process protein 1